MFGNRRDLEERLRALESEVGSLNEAVHRLAQAQDRIVELEEQLAASRTSHRDLAQHAAHLVTSLGHARAELRRAWDAETRDRAEGR